MESRKMNEAQFNQIVDELMFSIEETIDDSGADLDYENSAGMLTITCETNGSQIILSRQSAVSEIWLAVKSGGFHFKLDGDQWCNTVSGEPLSSMLSEACQAQAGETIEFDF
jgi:CyaY protein